MQAVHSYPWIKPSPSRHGIVSAVNQLVYVDPAFREYSGLVLVGAQGDAVSLNSPAELVVQPAARRQVNRAYSLSRGGVSRLYATLCEKKKEKHYTKEGG